MLDQYAVFGNPISHSRSPFIHDCFARQQDQQMQYRAIEVALDGFNQAVANFLQGEGKGLNVTVPFKEQAWSLAEHRTARAELAGAVNTLWRDEQGRICGDNTDGVGLVNDLIHNNGVKLNGARVLILGAGGAVRGVLQPLLEAGCSEVMIVNRTAEKAKVLAAHFQEMLSVDQQINAGGYADLENSQAYDVIINGTSASLSGKLPPIHASVVSTNTLCYDMMYGAKPTTFCQWAIDRSAARAIDGLGMLVEQAAEAFLCWRGVRPETAPVIALLRQSLAHQ